MIICEQRQIQRQLVVTAEVMRTLRSSAREERRSADITQSAGSAPHAFEIANPLLDVSNQSSISVSHGNRSPSALLGLLLDGEASVFDGRCTRLREAIAPAPCTIHLSTRDSSLLGGTVRGRNLRDVTRLGAARKVKTGCETER